MDSDLAATAGVEVRVEGAKRVADGVYGTILVIAVVAAFSKDDDATAATVLGGVLVTALVFWLVHVYAAVLAGRAMGDERPLPGLLRHAASDEWPLVEAALAPAVPLLLGAIGLLGRSASITIAIVVGLINLAVWGYAAGRSLRQTPLKASLSALAAVALGLVMVLLKSLIH